MHPYQIQDFYMFLSGVGILFITALGFLMVSEARRKHLTAVLNWLVPATLCATAELIIYIMMQINSSFGFRLGAFFFFVQMGIGTSALVLGAVTALRIRGMIRNWPAEVGGDASFSQQPSDYDKSVWPPPPTGTASQ